MIWKWKINYKLIKIRFQSLITRLKASFERTPGRRWQSQPEIARLTADRFKSFSFVSIFDLDDPLSFSSRDALPHKDNLPSVNQHSRSFLINLLSFYSKELTF